MERIVKSLFEAVRRETNVTPEVGEIVYYGLFCLILALLTIIGIGVVSTATCGMVAGYTAAFAAAVFRNFSGGAHFATPGVCTVVSWAVYPLFTWGLLYLIPTSARMSLALASGVAALLVAYTYAPVESSAKPITAGRRLALKQVSMGLATAWLLVLAAMSEMRMELGHSGVAVAVSSGLIWQSYTLTPLGEKTHALVDRAVSRALLMLTAKIT